MQPKPTLRPCILTAALTLILALAACDPKPGVEPSDPRPVEPKSPGAQGPAQDRRSACAEQGGCPAPSSGRYAPSALSL